MEDESFSIAEIQTWLQQALLQGQPMDHDPAKPVSLAHDIVNSSQRLSAERHLDIYKYSYIARLRACMKSQFGALAYALGGELFELFADQYLEANPSDSYTLNILGEKFPGFLKETRPDKDLEEKESWPDFMIGLAEFEYALSVIFDEPVEPDYIMATLDTPDEHLRAAPLLYLYHHQFPICSYYLEFSRGDTPEFPFPEESFCAVTRHNYKLGLFDIKKAQYYFLISLQNGLSVNAAKDHLAITFGFKRHQLDDIWPQWCANFISSGLLCSVAQ